MNKTLSVVIPCRNEESYIQKCLESIVKCDYPKDLIEVFVCDGQSEDRTASIVQSFSVKYPWIKLLNNEFRTTPHALNIGIRASNSEFVTILGGHSEVDQSYFSLCISDFSLDSKIGCTGGVLENVYDDDVSEAIGLAQSCPFGVGNVHFRTGVKSGFVDTVAFGTYKREVFNEIGLFDEELVRNQDDEFNFRLISKGYKIHLNPNAKCKYYVRGSFGKLWRQYFQYGYWKVFVNIKHKAVTSLRQLVPSALVLFVVLGICLTGVSPKFLFAFGLGMLIYLLSSVYFGYKTLFKRGEHSKVNLVLVLKSFYILHFSYGLGYLKGIWRFMILRSGPSGKSKELTR